MKAYRVAEDYILEDSAREYVIRAGSILVMDDGDTWVDFHGEPVPDGTPISIAASRIEPVDPGIGG